MKLKNVQIRMFSNDADDIIVDYSSVSSDLFLGPMSFNVKTLKDICFELSNNFFIDSIRVWGIGEYNILQCNDYDCHTHDWSNKEWILLREDHLDATPVHIFNMFLLEKGLGIMYDLGTNNTILNFNGIDYDVGRVDTIPYADKNKIIYHSGEWIWSKDEEVLNKGIQDWIFRIGNSCKEIKL